MADIARGEMAQIMSDNVDRKWTLCDILGGGGGIAQNQGVDVNFWICYSDYKLINKNKCFTFINV